MPGLESVLNKLKCVRIGFIFPFKCHHTSVLSSFTQSICEKQQLEFRDDMKALRGQLESTRKQLFRAGEEKSCLQMLTEQRSQEVRKLQEHLQENDKEC